MKWDEVGHGNYKNARIWHKIGGGRADVANLWFNDTANRWD